MSESNTPGRAQSIRKERGEHPHLSPEQKIDTTGRKNPLPQPEDYIRMNYPEKAAELGLFDKQVEPEPVIENKPIPTGYQPTSGPTRPTPPTGGSSAVKPKPVLKQMEDLQQTMVHQTASNPLAKYYRAAKHYIKLPSEYKYYPTGSVKLTINGEVSVFPMTIADEMNLKSPDALLNGHALEKTIASCVPDINPALIRKIVSPDLDVLLLAIRSASYGKMMQVETECPACKKENGFEVDLSNQLMSLKPMTEETALQLNESITVQMRPYDFESYIKIANLGFEENKLMQYVNESEMEEKEKLSIISESVLKITIFTEELLASSIEYVETPDGIVTDRNFITEWVKNIEKADFSKLQEHLATVNDSGLPKKHSMKCQYCEHQWEGDLSYDPTNFFG